MQVYGQNTVRVQDSKREKIMIVDKRIGYKKHKGDGIHPRPTIRIFVKKIS
ncbi:MAG TPA: hypothetical protein K8V00_00210 [Ligilactobacillus acidipiscis]|uniref:Uncharacterized protein n=1 Tax=Ligilactobacillus acidipiscis TaxID=89059 RepID=A0A921F5Z4_9LACO|nr:hypothetical protein [Ligilactobacillus acidipiscis]